MIFESANCTFSGVSSMDAWRNELIIYAFVDHEALQRLGAFVVEASQEGAHTGGAQVFVRALVDC
jgi:hypothetical protein